MALKRWKIICSVDGHVETTSEIAPTVCPVNAAHTIGDVTYTGEVAAVVVKSPNGTLWDITVDDAGVLDPQEVT